MAKKKQSFEESIQRLSEIVSQMEDHETPLEKSVALYKEGVELAMACAKILDEAEKQVTLLNQSAEGLFTEEPFDADSPLK